MSPTFLLPRHESSQKKPSTSPVRAEKGLCRRLACRDAVRLMPRKIIADASGDAPNSSVMSVIATRVATWGAIKSVMKHDQDRIALSSEALPGIVPCMMDNLVPVECKHPAAQA